MDETESNSKYANNMQWVHFNCLNRTDFFLCQKVNPNKDWTLKNHVDLFKSSFFSLFKIFAFYFHRIQDIDNGFFETFGSLLKRKPKDVLETALLLSNGLGIKSKGTIASRFAQDHDTISIHEDFISQLENPTAQKDDLIKEYSSLNVRNSWSTLAEIIFCMKNKNASKIDISGFLKIVWRSVQGNTVWNIE